MLSQIMKSETFAVIFSALIGLAIAAILRPVCSSSECLGYKQPPPKEIEKTVYKLKGKCYKFVSEDVDCPDTGVIEPFYSAL